MEVVLCSVVRGGVACDDFMVLGENLMCVRAPG